MMIALAFLVVVLAVLGYAATKPDTSHVERSTIVRAPAERIFDHVDDLHRWGAWSPWDKKDPSMQRTFSGPERGLGAVYGWEGNKDVGKGRMEIVESTTASKVRIRLQFLAPFEATSMATFTFVPEGDGTKVVWSMEGARPFPVKVIALFLDMDGMVGRDFETGLANLKAVAEA